MQFSSDGVTSCFFLEWLSGLRQKQNRHQLLERKPTLFLKVWQQKYSLLRKEKKKKQPNELSSLRYFQRPLVWWLLFFFSSRVLRNSLISSSINATLRACSFVIKSSLQDELRWRPRSALPTPQPPASFFTITKRQENRFVGDF